MRKNILISIVVGIIAVLIFLIVDVLYFPISFEKLDFVQRLAVDEINRKWDKKIVDIPLDKQDLVSDEELMNSLNFIERGFAKRIFKINPTELGFSGPFFSKEIPDSLVKVLETEIKLGTVEVGITYLPKVVFDDFARMNNQLKEDTGRELFVESGYRSPGYQAYLFFYYFPENGYSLEENAKWLTFPGYSEHNSLNTALDFINQDGISGEDEDQIAEDFTVLQEYKWLENNASKYNFYLSYPEGNPYGISFEPWHWHWEKK